ncbi:MAG TPA: glycosyltransferase [Terriglobales bacterium]|nr:glycosyltransferase [Terriglobales bacterium]
MRYLMVSTYPPTHCGIGAYAEQSVAQLRAQGHVVDVVSPDGQGNVDFAWDLRGGDKLLRLLPLLKYYDKVIIQYTWAFFYNDPFLRERRWETLQTTLCFMLLFLRKRQLEVVAHEIPYIPGKQGWLYKWQWKLAGKIVFHTPSELARFEHHYGMRLPRARIEIRAHHAAFQPFSQHERDSARRQLGLSQDALIFLCIGFLQRHKGFHRALNAFARAGLRDAELYVVGSMRVSDNENEQYIAELRNLATASPATHLIEAFVSNEDFDTWINAADWVVLPYSEIWSSGVLARARLLDRPAIVSAVGGLPDQADGRDLLFHTDEELISAFRTAALRSVLGGLAENDRPISLELPK